MSESKYSNEELFAEANKYATRDEMKKGSDLMYQALQRRGLLDKAFENHPNKGLKKSPNGYWQDKTNILKEAKKYKTRTEFQKHAAGAWDAAHKNGWLEECYQHMKLVGNKLNRIVYALFNRTESIIYIGLTSNFDRRLLAHHKSEKIKESILDKDHDVIFFTPGYVECRVAQQIEIEKIAAFKQDNYTVLNTKKGGELGGSTQFVTFEYAQQYIYEQKIETITELSNHPIAASIYKNDWMDKIIFFGGGDGYTIKPNGYWTFKRCQIEADKYETRTELQEKCGGAYCRAAKEGWLDEIFKSHPQFGLKIKRLPLDMSDEEFCALEAKKYKYRKDFQFNSPGCYKRACQNDWINTYQFEKFPIVKKAPKYSIEDIIAKVKCCSSFKELKNTNSKMYWYIYKAKLQNKFKSYLLVT